MDGPLEKLHSARLGLLFDQPFFGRLLCHLEDIVDPVACKIRNIETAGTDGTRIYWAPDFLEKLPMPELQFVLAHEVMHCALGHPYRGEAKLGPIPPKGDDLGRAKWQANQMRANIAMDLAINPILKDSGFTITKDCCIDDKYRGMSWEHIYNLLPEPKVIKLPAGACISPEPGDGKGESEGDEVEGQMTQGSWEAAVRASVRQGEAPAGLDRYVEELTASKIDWRAYAWQWLGAHTERDDYSYKRPNRRPSGFYRPALKSQAVAPIAFVVDTSGSVDMAQLGQFLSEGRAMADQLKPEKVYYAAADAVVGCSAEFMQGEDLVCKVVGGGGTDFRPAVKWAHDLMPRPACLIYFTDLMGSFPESSEIPILWVSIHPDITQKAPLGTTVPLL
jgi:predicted metal-dependent peptidase